MFNQFVEFVRKTKNAEESILSANIDLKRLEDLMLSLHKLIEVIADNNLKDIYPSVKSIKNILVQSSDSDKIFISHLKLLFTGSVEGKQFIINFITPIIEVDLENVAAVTAIARLFMSLVKDIKEQFKNRNPTLSGGNINSTQIANFILDAVKTSPANPRSQSAVTTLNKGSSLSGEQYCQESGIPMDRKGVWSGGFMPGETQFFNIYSEESIDRTLQYSPSAAKQVREMRADIIRTAQSGQLVTRSVLLDHNRRVTAENIAEFPRRCCATLTALLGNELLNNRISTTEEAVEFLANLIERHPLSRDPQLKEIMMSFVAITVQSFIALGALPSVNSETEQPRMGKF